MTSQVDGSVGVMLVRLNQITCSPRTGAGSVYVVFWTGASNHMTSAVYGTYDIGLPLDGVPRVASLN